MSGKTPEDENFKEKKLQLYISKSLMEYQQGNRVKFNQIIEELDNKDKSETVLKVWIKAFIRQINESYKNKEDFKVLFNSFLKNVKWFDHENHLKIIDFYENFLLASLSYNTLFIENGFQAVLSQMFIEDNKTNTNSEIIIKGKSFNNSDELSKFIKNNILYASKYLTVSNNSLGCVPLDSFDQEFMIEFFKYHHNYQQKFANFVYIGVGSMRVKEKTSRCFFICEKETKNDISYIKTLSNLQEKFDKNQSFPLNNTEIKKIESIARILTKIIEIYPLSKNLAIRCLTENFPHKRREEKILQNYLYLLLIMALRIKGIREGILSICIEKMVGIDVEIRLDMENREKTDEMASKLDNLMVVFFNFLEFNLKNDIIEFFPGQKKMNSEEFNDFLQIFLKIAEEKLIIVYQSKYVQFLLFFICSFIEKTNNYSEKFLSMLICNCTSKTKGKTLKTHCLAYLSSFLARSNFLSEEIVSQSLDFLLEYLKESEFQENNEDFNEKLEDFYQKLQAVMYILCFNEELIKQKRNILHVIMEKAIKIGFLDIINNDILDEFFFKTEKIGLKHNKNNEKNNKLQCLEIFFPFDPYLLKKSSKYVEKCYNYWRDKAQNEENNIIDCHETDSSSPWIGEITENKNGKRHAEDELDEQPIVKKRKLI